MKNSALIIAISATLVACGSGSSGGTVAPTPAPTNNTPTTSQPATSEPTTNMGIKTVANKSSGVHSSQDSYSANSDLNRFTIDGMTINLAPAGMQSSGFLQLQSATGVNGDNVQRFVSGTKYSQTRFGLLTKTGSDDVIAFSQGNPTADMPVTGTANYAGDYIGIHHPTGNIGTGTVTATVDFAAKTINGVSSTDSNGVEGVTLAGQIRGNTFSAQGGPLTAKGQFYGEGASELSGSYNNNGFYTAAFGAKKQ